MSFYTKLLISTILLIFVYYLNSQWVFYLNYFCFFIQNCLTYITVFYQVSALTGTNYTVQVFGFDDVDYGMNGKIVSKEWISFVTGGSFFVYFYKLYYLQKFSWDV